MEINISTENGRVPVTVMHVVGNIDSDTYEVFHSKADELIESGSRHILVDLSGTSYISSACLRALHIIFNKLRSIHPDENLNDEEMRIGISNGTYRSPHLKLINLSDSVRTAFDMSGFDMYIETFTDLNTAIASF